MTLGVAVTLKRTLGRVALCIVAAAGAVLKQGHGTGVTAMALRAAPEATNLPIRGGSSDPDAFEVGGDSEDYHHLIRYAVDNGADVIVMAWGFCCRDRVRGHPARQARRRHGDRHGRQRREARAVPRPAPTTW